MIGIELAVLALATWRLTHMLLRENGPWGAFRRLRVALGVVYDPQDDTRIVAFRYEISTCMWCLSMWTGAIAGLVFNYTYYEYFSIFIRFAVPFAISACCVALDHLFGMR